MLAIHLMRPKTRVREWVSSRSGLVAVAAAAAGLVVSAAPAQGQRCLYVSTQIFNSVSVIDTETQAVSTTVPVGQGPNRLATVSTGAGTFVYVANSFLGGMSVSVIDTSGNDVVATVTVGIAPSD